MDSKKAEALRKKYWEGKTKLDEERELKIHTSASMVTEDPDQAYFNYLTKKSAQNPLGEEFDDEILDLIDTENNELKPKKSILTYWYIAASLVLVISASIIFKNEFTKSKKPIQVAQVDTYDDPEKAFEETKRALLLISSKLNRTTEYASEFSKFEESQKTLKQN